MRACFVAALAVVLGAAALGVAAPAGAFQSDDQCFAEYPVDSQQPAFACNFAINAPIAGEADGACVPEPIYFEGRAIGHDHFTVKTQDGNVFATSEEHAVATLNGVGELTGARYHFTAGANGTTMYRVDNGADVTTGVLFGQENAQGPLPDLTLHIVFHTTVDATGRVHQEVVHVILGCRTHGGA